MASPTINYVDPTGISRMTLGPDNVPRIVPKLNGAAPNAFWTMVNSPYQYFPWQLQTVGFFAQGIKQQSPNYPNFVALPKYFTQILNTFPAIYKERTGATGGRPLTGQFYPRGV
jgi:hypothetical protein